MLVASLLILGCLIALASGRVPPVLAFAATLTLAGVLGVAPSSELLSGLSSTGVVTVAAMLVVAAGVVHTGIVSRATRRILGSASNLQQSLIRLLFPVGLASSLMNNTPINAMTIPAAQELEQTRGIPARRVLMPIAFAAALGGTITLIGTSSNLLIASLADLGGVELNFFAFTPVAIPTFIVGIVLVILVVRRLIPKGPPIEVRALQWRVELPIAPRALLVNKTLASQGLASTRDFTAVTVIRATEEIAIDERLEAGDVVVFQANADGVGELWGNPRFGQKEQRLYEVTLGAEATGNLGVLNARDDMDVISARNATQALSETPAQAGELLYVTADAQSLVESVDGVAMVADVGNRAPQVAKTTKGVAILGVVVVVLMLGIFPTEWVASAGALAMLLFRVITPRAAFRALNWNLLGVLAGAVGLGAIATSSGLTDAIADWVTRTSGDSVAILVVLVAVVAVVLAAVVTTAAAVSMLVPIILAVSASLSVAPEPLLALLAVAACLSFINPFSNQSFLLVMGPGGYRFKDYVRLGTPAVLATLVTAAVSCWLWLAWM
ncbi:MAG: SLC13 family permease [Actinomycetota bacterium]|nr:SLC13 family permease [Actinomycetota bacterium]